MRDESRLKVKWFDAWQPALDAALGGMPEQEACPRELFKLLAENPSPTRKRLALVSEGGEPVALICLRRKQRHWVPVEQGVCPGATPPAKEGYLLPALAALRTDVRLSDWPTPPPREPWVWQPDWPPSYPVYKADLAGDFEEHWRKGSFLKKDVRTARRRCRAYTFAVDEPGSAEWILDSWEQRWRSHANRETVVVDDCRVATRFFQAQGRCHAFLLLDGDKPIAGSTVWVEGTVLRGAHTAFDPAYVWHRPGTYLMDRLFHWAASNGYTELNLGGYHEYKSRFAPARGELWGFGVCPRYLQMMKAPALRLKLGLVRLRYRLAYRSTPSGRGQAEAAASPTESL